MECKLIILLKKTPLGTGGAIKEALKICHSDYVFVSNGDSYFDINLKELEKVKSKIVIAIKKMKSFKRYGNLILDKNRVKEFREKEFTLEGFINTGIYLLKKDIFQNYSLKDNFAMEKDFFQKYTEELEIKTVEGKGYFIDIGIPQDYQKFILYLKNFRN